MKITVRGGSAEQRKFARSIAKFSAYKLMTKRLADSLTVNINLKNHLRAKEGVYGDVDYEDLEARRPKEFIIRTDSSMIMRPLLTTIAHEMVHVKQFARDEMREVRKNGTQVNRYNGKYFSIDQNYWEQPWEIEAHGWERSLFELWAEAEGLFKEPKKNKWVYEDLYPKGYKV